jgi:two-component system nitrate/nitrite response regulator NarL
MPAATNGLARTYVWLVDEQPLRRSGLRAHLAASGFTIGAEGATIKEVRSRAQKEASPAIIVIDLAQGMTVVEDAIASHRDARVIVLADRASLPDIVAAFQAGVQGYLMKSITPAALTESLRLAMTGEKIFPSELSCLLARLGAHLPDAEAPTQPVGGIALSPQELIITRRIAEGCPNKFIAQSMSITESTVKAHVKTLMRKIGVSNRTQAAIWAHQHGLGHTATHQPAP